MIKAIRHKESEFYQTSHSLCVTSARALAMAGPGYDVLSQEHLENLKCKNGRNRTHKRLGCDHWQSSLTKSVPLILKVFHFFFISFVPVFLKIPI